jgi:pilus assembly protein Flp/PilA
MSRGGARLLSQLLSRFWDDQSGATAIEYSLIAAGISVVIIAAVNGIGTKHDATFGSISAQLK